MNANDHVEFTGMIPKELRAKKNSKGKLLKKPFYGVIQSIKGDVAVVKPKSQRFNVEINISQLTVVDDDATVKSQKHPYKGRKKKGVNRPAIKKVVKKAADEIKPEPVVETKPEPTLTVVSDQVVEDKPCDTAATLKEEPVKPADAFHETPEPIPVPKIPVDEPQADPGNLDWMKDEEEVAEEPIVITRDANIDPFEEEDHTRSGGTIIYVVIAVVALAAAGIYYFFF